jgi:hypothetical protein
VDAREKPTKPDLERVGGSLVLPCLEVAAIDVSAAETGGTITIDATKPRTKVTTVQGDHGLPTGLGRR